MLGRLLAYTAMHPRQGFEIIRVLSAYRRSLERLRMLDGDLIIPDQQLQDTCLATGCSRATVDGVVQRWFREEPLSLLANSLRPGLANFLSAAKDANLRIAAFSDYDAKDKLEALCVGHYFDLTISSADPEVQRYKPDPRGLLVALARLNVSTEEAVYIGDRPEVDAEAARRAGVRAVVIGARSRRDRASAEKWLIAKDFDELEQRLRRGEL